MAGKLFYYALAPLLFQLVAGCSDDKAASDRTQVKRSPARSDHSAEHSRLVVVFGDSLYAGYGLKQGEGFAPELQRALSRKGLDAYVHNAGVSGDTSAAGLQRLAFTLDGLPRKPDLVIVGLGGNDMLRGLSPEQTRANLDAILNELDKRHIHAMLTGMLAAPNLGKDYADAFNAIYPDLAKKHSVPLYPFFLKDVTGQRDLLLEDGIHPNAQGVDIIVRHVAPVVASSLAA
ncbi:acyl-CoA thioesterase-1 [Rhizorhapis suberifaciens]|uniref:Acyl-CoA thioesterase-1 n=1 Tax=Rhizorhapis suberifaciens TaxID=13656 RepID=A0A840HS23_9SPHN|nr:acyl-CoA thioesterase-1 [Rhizorhapis suberifaciens]